MLPPAAVPHAPLGLCMCVSGVLMALDVTQEDIICAPPANVVSLSSFMDVLYFVTQ